jgi:hypothetical protein
MSKPPAVAGLFGKNMKKLPGSQKTSVFRDPGLTVDQFLTAETKSTVARSAQASLGLTFLFSIF